MCKFNADNLDSILDILLNARKNQGEINDADFYKLKKIDDAIHSICQEYNKGKFYDTYQENLKYVGKSFFIKDYMYDSFNDIKIDAYIKLISPLTIGSSEFNCLTIPTKLKYGKRKLEPNGTFHSWDWGIYIDNEFIIPTIDSINKCNFENSEEISDEMFLEKIDVFIDELKSAMNTDILKKSATDMLDEINKLR